MNFIYVCDDRDFPVQLSAQLVGQIFPSSWGLRLLSSQGRSISHCINSGSIDLGGHRCAFPESANDGEQTDGKTDTFMSDVAWSRCCTFLPGLSDLEKGDWLMDLRRLKLWRLLGTGIEMLKRRDCSSMSPTTSKGIRGKPDDVFLTLVGIAPSTVAATCPPTETFSVQLSDSEP